MFLWDMRELIRNKTEYWRTADLTSYGRQMRKNDPFVDRMVTIIDEFGFKIPMLIRGNGQVVDGDLRLKAARKMGMTEVPVILCDEWSEGQVKAFRLAANRSGNWAAWDLELVALEMEDLKGLGFDLNLTAFDPIEISKYTCGDVGAQENDIPEAPQTAVTRVGDLWVFNAAGGCAHRVLCGDATSPENVARLLGEAKPVLLTSDPPFGVSLDSTWRERAGLGRQRQTGTIANDDRVDWSQAYRLFPGNVAYIWHAGVHAAETAAGIEACGFRIRAQIIWVKQHFALSRGDYHWKHEPCWYAVREGKASNWSGDRTQATVWEVANLNAFGGSKEETATGHGAQKPVELMRRPILNNTQRGEIIYDPFLGSGTNVIAAEFTERVCYGLEIDPRYVDVIVQRWQTLSGKEAVLDGDGRTFRQVSEERGAAVEAPPCPDRA